MQSASRVRFRETCFEREARVGHMPGCGVRGEGGGLGRLFEIMEGRVRDFWSGNGVGGEVMTFVVGV